MHKAKSLNVQEVFYKQEKTKQLDWNIMSKTNSVKITEELRELCGSILTVSLNHNLTPTEGLFSRIDNDFPSEL